MPWIISFWQFCLALVFCTNNEDWSMHHFWESWTIFCTIFTSSWMFSIVHCWHVWSAILSRSLFHWHCLFRLHWLTLLGVPSLVKHCLSGIRCLILPQNFLSLSLWTLNTLFFHAVFTCQCWESFFSCLMPLSQEYTIDLILSRQWNLHTTYRIFMTDTLGSSLTCQHWPQHLWPLTFVMLRCYISCVG